MEGLFVQSAEVSGKESSMFIWVSQGGVRSHVCVYPQLPRQEGSLYSRDTLMGTALCPLFFTEREVLLAAAGIEQSMLVGMRGHKGTNPKKSLHPAPTHKPVP